MGAFLLKSAPVCLLTKSDNGGTITSVCVNRRKVMKKRILAAVVSMVMALAVFTGCGNAIKGHEARVIDGDQSSQGGSDENSTNPKINDSISPLYDPNIEKANNIDYLKADNMKFYFERMVVAGDSIANGWQYYGLLPKNRSIAYGGLSTFGFTVWEFDTTGKSLGMRETLKKVKPSLLYVCLGMNDVNIRDKDTFASQYLDLLKKLKSAVPDCLIVVQSITPVAKTNVYKQVTNSAVKAYNTRLRQVVAEFGREDVIYFNAYNSLLDENGQLDMKYEAGDGLHINTEAYKKLLEDLSKRLNQEMAKQRIEAIEEQRKEKSNQ